jgi:hypothetical protein
MSKSASILRLASVNLNLLSCKIGSLGPHAVGHPKLEEHMVTLKGFVD